jgi:hypothetical protein
MHERLNAIASIKNWESDSQKSSSNAASNQNLLGIIILRAGDTRAFTVRIKELKIQDKMKTAVADFAQSQLRSGLLK